MLYVRAVIALALPTVADVLVPAWLLHGTGGRVVGPVAAGDRVTVVEDTTTTGSAAMEAIEALRVEGIEVVQVIALVDRSGGAARERFETAGVPFVAVFGVADLGVEE